MLGVYFEFQVDPRKMIVRHILNTLNKDWDDHDIRALRPSLKPHGVAHEVHPEQWDASNSESIHGTRE